jgi:parallel beta-helix repeat protein
MRTDSGAPLRIFSCTGLINQQFKWNSQGEIRVVPAQGAGEMCLDASGGQGRNGDPIIVWPCSGTPNQKWTATAKSEIKGVNGKCIDVVKGSTANGTRLQLWDCYATTNQLFDNSSVSTTPPTGPTPTPTPPTGVAVQPGQSIQAAVNANPAGTQFVLKAGTHVRQQVIPKDGDTFVGEAGTVLDGQGATRYAFWAWTGSRWVNNVTIRGLKVTNYTPPVQDGAISASAGPGNSSTGWVVDRVESSYNSTGGIHVGAKMRLTNSNVHHNLQLGVGGSGDSIVIENNEIAYNNYTKAYESGWEAGGSKFSVTRWLVVRGNFVHHNYGPGLWTDTDNIYTLYENNRAEDNAGEGIFHEISYNAVIRNNQVKRNGLILGRWAYAGGITISMSPNVEVYGNTLEGNYQAISALQQGDAGRGGAPYGRYLVQNLYVHDNVMWLGPGGAGLSDDTGDPAVFASRNNRFVHNTYHQGTRPRPFYWKGERTWGEWQGAGQDLTGSFGP